MDDAAPSSPAATILKAVFLLLAALVLGAVGYAFWIILRYRDITGV